MLIESESAFVGRATKNGIDKMNNFSESSVLSFVKLAPISSKIKYENSCGTIPAIIAKTMIISDRKIDLIGFGESFDIFN